MKWIGLGAILLIFEGCAPKIGGSDYSLAGAGEVNRAERGTIVSVRVVNINAREANEPGVGAAAGAVGGGVLAGSLIGQKRGSLAAGAGGALLGGLAGHFIEQGLVNQQGFEYTVKMDDGSLKVIAQGAEPALQVGQRVLVVGSYKSRGRVIPDRG